jgi:hypothetical protein
MAQKELKLDPPAKRRFSNPKGYSEPTWGSERYMKTEHHYQRNEIPGEYDTATHHVSNQTVTDVYENYDNEGWKYIRSWKQQSKNQLYPCIGGVMNGQKIYHGHPEEDDYIDFNIASRYGRRGKKQSYPSLVFISKELLKS